MRMKSSSVRLIAMCLAAIVFIAIWLGFTGEANKAQIRKVDAKFEVPEKFLRADDLTREIRNRTNDFIHVPIRSERDRANAGQLGKIVGDYGSFVVVAANESIAARRFSDGSYKFDTTVHLPGATFDPLTAPLSETVTAGSKLASGKGYYVVQLGGIATDEILGSIRGMGMEVIQYVPNNAFIVYGEGADASRVAEHSRVRWIGSYASEYKFVPTLAAEAKGATDLYNIAVFSRADLERVAAEIANVSGGNVFAKMPLQATFFNVVRVEMTPDEIAKIAGIADVARIDSYEYPKAEDERAAHIVAGNYASSTVISGPGYNPLTQFGFDGTNVSVAVSDDGISIPGNGGFYLTTANTANANLRGSTAGASGGHGHLNASIISGDAPFGVLDPTGHNYGLGIAPKSHIVNIAFLKSGYSGSDADAANDAVVTPGPNGVNATISNNSWGAGLNGNVYDSLASTYDSLARDASAAAGVDPLLFVFSAGNSGQSGLTRPKMAKNVIATGSCENIRTELEAGSNNLDDMSSFSSRGLAADGRIKPDIAAPGDTITGSRAGSCTSVTSCFEANHAWSEGTSHAAPQIAGVAALFTQFWKSMNAGVNPSIAMTKAAILQTGQEMNGVGATSPLPNRDEGWGRANMRFMFNSAGSSSTSRKYVDQTVSFLSPGDNIVYNGRIVDGTKPFRATLVWTDPAGVADPALVNNLDLEVAINGVTYRGNVFSGGLSIIGGSPDNRNNVEQVWRSGDATNSPVSVKIIGAALNGDGILGNGDATDQHFALVLYNYEDAAVSNFSISGRVASQAGKGIFNAFVTLSSGPTVIASSSTNSFGYYSLPFVPGNQSYTVAVTSKRYTFAPQVVNLGGSNLTGVNFTALTGSP